MHIFGRLSCKYRPFNNFFTIISLKRSNFFRILIPIQRELMNMSRNETCKELEETQENSDYKKHSGEKFPPSEIYLCVLGNGSVSSPRSLYMFTDRNRYLFNCGEGTQRVAHEHKMKLSKLSNIFITYKSWENLGGLLGLSLTIQEIGVPEIILHGPEGVNLLYEDAASFMSPREKLNVKMSDMRKPFVDNCMEVKYIPIQRGIPPSKPDWKTELEEDNSYPCAKRVKLTDEDRASDIIICYACKGHSKPGQLLFQKCIEYGVPPGPLLGKLKSGTDITLPSGRVVLSKDVVAEEHVCPVFLVVECPSESFISSFVKKEEFSEYQASANVQSNIASLVVHFTPPHVFETQQYQEWISRFPETTCHMVLNSDNASLCSAAVHRIQHKLNLLHPNIFTLLHESDVRIKEKVTKNIIQANNLYRYHLRPFKGLDKDCTIALDTASYIHEAFSVNGFEESLIQLEKQLKKETVSNENAEPTEVAFLGTGSSIPSKVRNVSGILVRLSNNKSLIMDCGEGTYSQLFRLYGPQITNVLLQQLGCIFISHMHADHHLGLIELLKCRKTALAETTSEIQPLVIIGPQKLYAWLKEYHNKFEPILPNHRFLSCYSLKHKSKSISSEDETLLNKCCENIDISTVPVNHCPDAHGVILNHNLDKWKVVYSGDTTPCQALIQAGKDCTLLIHEATMEDDLSDEAAKKRHSTTSEAIMIADKMNAKHTILTHFSQRYAKVPLFNDNFHNQIGCAFDNMKVYLHELHILPLFIPTLKHLFAEDVQDLQVRGNKRRERKNILKSSIVANFSK